MQPGWNLVALSNQTAPMPIAITDDHRALAGTVSSFLAKHQSTAAARALLEAAEEPNASFYAEAAELGWLGLHVPEELGGSGFGLEETVVVVEELGRGLAPGAFVPSLIASAVLVAAGDDAVRQAVGARPGRRHRSPARWRSTARPSCATVRCTATPARCSAPGWPTCCSSAVGDDVAVVDARAPKASR